MKRPAEATAARRNAEVEISGRSRLIAVTRGAQGTLKPAGYANLGTSQDGFHVMRRRSWYAALPMWQTIAR